MKAWLTARRVKKGQEEEFRRKWRGGDLPEGMLDAFLLQDEEDPRETLSVSFWDTAEQLLKYRTSEAVKKRRDELSDVVDKDRWSRSFVAFGAWDIPVGGGKKKWLLLLPLLVAAAGAGAYFLLKQRGAAARDEWDSWEPEPADTFQPPESPFIDTGMPASSQPLETTNRNGEQGAAPARLVRDVMTANPETVTTATDVQTAARIMRDRNVGLLPVVADGRLAGVITDRDIALGVSARDQEPADIKVGDMMSEVPATVRPDDSVEAIARSMADRQIRRVLVVDGTQLVGIVSLGDLATEGAQRAAGAALQDISEPAKPNR
ncbi:MAG TPA: CBS domain-containing protein [Hyphomonadaceae bacterium]|nr:CBS domain-containing protein [Hyphomonadaceae bacterium]